MKERNYGSKNRQHNGWNKFWNQEFCANTFHAHFPSENNKKTHQNTHQNTFEWTVTPKYHVVLYCAVQSTSCTCHIWYDITQCTCSVRMHKGNFCLIFSLGRRPMRNHKCIWFFLQKFWIFWICNQILGGRCASTDFCQVSFRVKTLALDLEGLRTDFPWDNYMVRKTLF